MSAAPQYGVTRRRIVIKMYRELRSVSKAADAAEVGRTYAYNVLREAGEIASHPPVFTAKCATEAIRLYKTGLSCRSVAEQLAKRYSPAPSQQWVFIRVQEAGILRSKSRAMELRETERHGKDFDRIRAVALRLTFEKLWSVKRIADLLGVSKKVVARAIPREFRCNPSLATQRRKWQAHLPDVERRRALRDEVIARRSRGESYPHIVKATGLSTSTVHRYLHDAGLTKARADQECGA